MLLNPIEIKGNWDKGFVLDNHIVKSEYIGEDVYGHPKYNTERSILGELIFRLKYRNNLDALDEIIKIITPFLDDWQDLRIVDIILPVPSSKSRNWQPVNEICNKIAEYLNICTTDKVLKKISNSESKNMNSNEKKLENTIIACKKAKKKHNILLVDDLYQTGETLKECTKVLKYDKLLNKIFVLVMTKTRN